MNISSLLRTKWLLAVVAAAVVGSAAYAFAATLGVSSSSLGAGDTTVSSCIGTTASTEANVTYTTAYDSSLTEATDGSFAVNNVTVTIPKADPCKSGDVVQVVFTGTGALATPATFTYTLGTNTGDTPDGTTDGVFTLTPTTGQVPAADVTGVHVSESGS